MRGGWNDSVWRKKRIHTFIPVSLGVCVFLIVLSVMSGGCLDFLRNNSVDSGDATYPAVEDLSVPTSSLSPSLFQSPKPSAGEHPAPGGTAPGKTVSDQKMTPDDETEVVYGDTNDSGGGTDTETASSFSLTYTPPDGYVADEGEVLAMQVQVVPEKGFSAPVSLRMDIIVPSPGLPFVTLWKGSYDLGTTSPPYPPVSWYLPLDPDTPPEEYEWVTGVARQAKALGITTISVHVRVTAVGGGQMVTESPSYIVRLS